MILHSSSKNYILTMHSDFNFIEELLSEENAMIVIDKKLYELYYKELFSKISKEHLYIIEALENNKNIDTALAICEIMTKIPAKRNAHLISFGGGIVQDITGFAANILYRGINWTFVPTTLLAACDSCIGGKTSLNYKKYKNLLGTFYPPDDIHICPLFFKSLTEKDYQSGLGEVAKFNIMFGSDGLKRIENDMDMLLGRDESTLIEYIENSLSFKKQYIEEDEFDKGIRINLNFAHTFGHAFESMSNYVIPHGTAVALGMVVANRVSLSRGWLSKEIVERIEKVLFRIINVDLSIIPLDMEKIIAAIRKDKKQINSELTAVLMYDDMKLRLVHNLQVSEAEDAIQYVFNVQ